MHQELLSVMSSHGRWYERILEQRTTPSVQTLSMSSFAPPLLVAYFTLVQITTEKDEKKKSRSIGRLMGRRTELHNNLTKETQTTRNPLRSVRTLGNSGGSTANGCVTQLNACPVPNPSLSLFTVRGADT